MAPPMIMPIPRAGSSLVALRAQIARPITTTIEKPISSQRPQSLFFSRPKLMP